MASAPSFDEGRDAVVMLSSSTTRKYFAQHVASVASALFFNPAVEVHVHTAYDHQIMAAELLKLPFLQARESTAMQRLHFHALSPRPAGQLTLTVTLTRARARARTRTRTRALRGEASLPGVEARATAAAARKAR
jgi:hypothetical protein